VLGGGAHQHAQVMQASGRAPEAAYAVSRRQVKEGNAQAGGITAAGITHSPQANAIPVKIARVRQRSGAQAGASQTRRRRVYGVRPANHRVHGVQASVRNRPSLSDR